MVGEDELLCAWVEKELLCQMEKGEI